MRIQTFRESGRIPHAILILDDTDGEDSIRELLTLYDCAPADTVFVKEIMPPGDAEKKSATMKHGPYSYKIEPLRTAVSMGNMRPQFGSVRVFVFREFDTMSEACQNTLLKFIEEPAEFNRFVMTAASKMSILPTILSRVVTITNTVKGDNPDRSDTDSDATVEIAAAILVALKSRDRGKSEYNTAAAFARIKDRTVLRAVLQRLLSEFAAIMADARKPEKIIAATDVLQKYIKRTEVNPNVAITVTACAAELHNALHA
jgi:DNA polymerase III delta prime subunit